MNTEVKRPNYFRGQFLIESDFVAEQNYHRELRQKHLLALHGWGVIGDGMQVQKSEENAQSLIVSPGVAVDKNGQEIILATSRTVTLESAVPNTEIFLAIRYGEARVESDRYTGPTSSDAIQEYTRITEQPQFQRTSDRPNDGLSLLLAKVTVDENGHIAEIDTSVRQYASCWIAPGELTISQINKKLVINDVISLSKRNRTKLVECHTAKLNSSEPKSVFLLVYAYSDIDNSEFSWQQKYKTENGLVKQFVEFKIGNDQDTEVSVQIYKIL